LHPHPYSSKFPPLTLQVDQELGASLPEDSGDRAGVGGKVQLAVPCIGNVDSHREGPRQEPANDFGQRFLAAAPCLPCGKGGVGAEDALERLWRTRHGG
jgi:hypothetical protein